MSETQEHNERVTFKMRIILFWAIESERQYQTYTLESCFFGLWWGRAYKRVRLLGSLCASPFRLHNTVVSAQLSLISFQFFLKTSLALKTQKPR